MAAALPHTSSRRMYSWWWDSHISPKNSKWLQENLTDMDVKVKQMIKLIEEDADSFARRAEMYYKKRPELMKMVEEFYRAYRALAERYDHATGVIRHAHRTMSEAFPNQVPMMLTDDLPAGALAEAEPHTPDTRHPSRAFLDPDELQKDASHVIKRNRANSEEPDYAIIKTGLKQLNDLIVPGEHENHARFAEGNARRGLNFLDTNNGSHDAKAQAFSESERVTKAETEILALKKALAKLEGEKEAGLLQYQQSLERLSNLETEVSRAQGNSLILDARANKAEAEVQALKEALDMLEAEREASLLQYHEYLEKISNLEKTVSFAQKNAGELNDRATTAETEVESLKQDLARVEVEKEAALAQYQQCLETLSKLEERLKEAEENARRINEQANAAEREIEALKLEVVKLTEEKEDAALRYQQCLEIISDLEHKLACAEEEMRRLNSEIHDGIEKLRGSEQKCLLLETSNQTLQSELQSFAQKVGSQSEELTEKQKELGRLWSSLQEERMRFIEAETAFQTLQGLHSQSQEELRSLAADLHGKTEVLENVESRKQALEDEVRVVKEENQILNEIKFSSAVSINNLQDEILKLRETIEKLEQEVELRVDERNALQQEIYCLKEELNDVNKRHITMREEVRSIGFDPQCFGSSVKGLQDENATLKETCEIEKGEKAALLEKLEIMEKLLAKNSVLENSLSDLNAELQSVRGTVKMLEETCQSLLVEKSTLVAEKEALFSQLQTTSENLERLSDKNKLLENSLFDVNAELEGLRAKSKILEETCELLDHEKSGVISEKETLVSQWTITQKTLNDLEKQHGELEQKHLELKGERESALQKVEELLVSLYSGREEHSRVMKLTEDELAEKESRIHILQEDANCREKEYEEELERAIHAQIEIFVLQKCIQDLENKNFSLLIESQRLLEASKMSERMISKLETENVQKQVDVNSLSEKIRILRIGLVQVLRTLDIDGERLCEDMLEEDQMLLNHIHGKLQETKKSFDSVFCESQQAAIENSILVTFLRELRLNFDNLVTERDALDEEFRIQSTQFLALQLEVQKISEKNQELNSTVCKGEERMEVMAFEMENLQKQLVDMEEGHGSLKEENRQIFEEKKSLTRRFLDLGEEKRMLEEEMCFVIHEIIAQSNLSLVYENVIFEKLLRIKELGEDREKLCSMNNDLEERLKIMVWKLEHLESENSHVKESFVKSNVEQQLVESVNDELSCQIRNEKELRSVKENELLGAAEMFRALHTEKTELQGLVDDLKIKYDEARGILEDQAIQISKLSSDKDRQSEELGSLCEVNRKLEYGMRHLHQELEETKLREKKLTFEVQKGANEIEQWETEAARLYAELQISSVNGTLFEGKVGELSDACENLEHKNFSKEMESEQLKESFVKSNVELRLVESVNDELSCQIRNEEELRSEKENELLEAAEMFRALHTEKTELQGMVEDLKIKYDQARVMLEDQANRILKLSSDKDHQSEELEETKLREKMLTFEVQRGTNEIEQWETEAARLYAELQFSSVNGTLFEGKVRELSDACDNLARRTFLKETESEQLKERVSKLEGENGRLRGRIAAYVPAVTALNDCITSLEMQTLVHAKPHGYEESKVKNSANRQNAESGQQTVEDESHETVTASDDALADFQDMQRRIHAIEAAVKQISRSKLVARADEANVNRHGLEVLPVTEIEVLPKDIMLDQISECSSYGISRRETLEGNDRMLELWATSDKTPKIVNEPAEYRRRGATNVPRNKHPSSESFSEKELSVDKLEISRRMTQPREEGNNKRKILERLDSDAQKLTNLQITIQDLTKKVEVTEKSAKGKGADYDTVKGQLESAQEAVTKLFDTNRKLTKNVEEGTTSSSVRNDSVDLDESGSVSGRRTSEQARRGSEKIGQLQLEVQRLQFLLLKLDAGKESKEKTRFGDRSARVLLRDYLYGGTRTNNNNQKKKKKVPFCACMNPPTKGD